MYKLLLSWRYLCTRYIALASIISVTLGVATLIVVNSVMSGFAVEMHKRLHGILSDLVFESVSLDGFPDPAWHEKEIRQVLGDDVAGITAIVHSPAMLSFSFRGEYINKQINLIGVDDATYALVSDFSQYLLHPANQEKLSWQLRNGGYGQGRESFPDAGWDYRRQRAAYESALREQIKQAREVAERSRRNQAAASGAEPAEGAAEESSEGPPPDPTAEQYANQGTVFDPAKKQHAGIILGISTCSVRHRNAAGKVEDVYLCRPGDDVQVSFPNSGTPPKVVSDNFTVVDLYESKMSEYDSTFAFVPLRKFQELRGMIDPSTGITAVTSIQIKLRPGANLTAARDKLRNRFPAEQFPYRVQTWQDMQGPLLSAVNLETTILNILLFLIIAVAGFGILATFFMIVVEKTKDIGILKALGAPSRGVMSIFLGYGLSLGIVGSGVGAVLGFLFVRYINQIAGLIGWLTGREVFDPTVYYFQEIPTILSPWTMLWVTVGASLVAVLASVLPALRAARLHPVEALRYE